MSQKKSSKFDNSKKLEKTKNSVRVVNSLNQNKSTTKRHRNFSQKVLKNSTKTPKHKKEIVVMVSGGFDPIHPGHIRLFDDAKKLGDKLVVVINNDNWILKKKGCGFMSAKDRSEVIKAFRSVDRVVISSHKKNPTDMSVSEDLKKIKPDIFANGGDRNETDAKNPLSYLYRDVELCKRLNIQMVFNVGRGGKIRSSSELLKNYAEKKTKK